MFKRLSPVRDLLKTVVLPKEIKDAILTGLFKRLSPVLNTLFIRLEFHVGINKDMQKHRIICQR